jgi:DNA replication protein DnaC
VPGVTVFLTFAAPIYLQVRYLEALRNLLLVLHKNLPPHLVILDDFGLRPITAQGAEDLYEIIHHRYERGSIVLTSNRSPSEWPELFGDSILASAALDRLTHHARVTIITGDSYRQMQRRKEVTKPKQEQHNQ